jgi:hypothetical protein
VTATELAREPTGTRTFGALAGAEPPWRRWRPRFRLGLSAATMAIGPKGIFSSEIHRRAWPGTLVLVGAVELAACGGAVHSAALESISDSGMGGKAGAAGNSSGGGGTDSGLGGDADSGADARPDSRASYGPSKVSCEVARGKGYTPCVSFCGDPAVSVPLGATCVDGYIACDPPRIPAVSCPAGSWGSVSCGPWVDRYNCQTHPVCSEGFWGCAISGDGGP